VLEQVGAVLVNEEIRFGIVLFHLHPPGDFMFLFHCNKRRGAEVHVRFFFLSGNRRKHPLNRETLGFLLWLYVYEFIERREGK